MENDELKKPLKLTKEQCSLIEENHKLIYWYKHKYLKEEDMDEWYDILANALCYCAMKHEPSKGSFSNYYKLCASCAVANEFRNRKAKKRIQFETEYLDNYHNLEYNDEILANLELEEWLNSSYAEIIKMKLSGKTQLEIAQQLGISRSQVSNILKRIRRLYNANNR